MFCILHYGLSIGPFLNIRIPNSFPEEGVIYKMRDSTIDQPSNQAKKKRKPSRNKVNSYLAALLFLAPFMVLMFTFQQALQLFVELPSILSQRKFVHS